MTSYSSRLHAGTLKGKWHSLYRHVKSLRHTSPLITRERVRKLALSLRDVLDQVNSTSPNGNGEGLDLTPCAGSKRVRFLTPRRRSFRAARGLSTTGPSPFHLVLKRSWSCLFRYTHDVIFPKSGSKRQIGRPLPLDTALWRRAPRFYRCQGHCWALSHPGRARKLRPGRPVNLMLRIEMGQRRRRYSGSKVGSRSSYCNHQQSPVPQGWLLT